MKSRSLKTLIGALGIVLAAATSFAAPWGPPANGDIILGFQATAGEGATTNVFYNLGSVSSVKTTPNAGLIVNLNAELTAAFGAGWYGRNDVFFGAYGQQTGSSANALDANGDPNRTAYLSRAATTAGGASFHTGYTSAPLGVAFTFYSGMVSAFSDVNYNIAPNGNNAVTATQGGNGQFWSNSWTQWNTPTSSFTVYTPNIQNNFGKGSSPTRVDIQRLARPTSGTSTATYLTTLEISSTGNVSLVQANPPVTLDLAVSPAGTGTISGATDGQSFATGATANLTANPATGYVFSAWSGASTSTSNPLALTMTGNLSVTANFVKDLSDADGDGIAAYDELVIHGTSPTVANTPPALTGSYGFKGSLTSGLAGAEISAFDPASDRLFVTSSAGLQVIDLSNPATPVLLSTIDLSTAPFSAVSNDVSSVAVKNGVVAASCTNANKEATGSVVFLTAATAGVGTGHLQTVTVGYHPDMVVFSPDGNNLLVANEGEYIVGGAGTTPGSVSVVNTANGFSTPPAVTEANFNSFDADVAALKAAGVRIFGSELPSNDLEPEYIAIAPDGLTAQVTLQEANAIALLDIASVTFTAIVPLGTKNFAPLLADFTDRDLPGPASRIALTTGNPVSGLYMPDGIASFAQGGNTYYIMANEGDDRNDFLPSEETARVSALDLDETVPALANEAGLKANTALGRLTVTQYDEAGNLVATPYQKLLMLGGRSITIRDASGVLVWDSGDLIERTIASYGIVSAQPNMIFDDTRSDNKGPEPEGVVVAQLGTKLLAFVGLERSNGVLVLDITNAVASGTATVETFLRNTGDSRPEGVLIIEAADSPSGKMLTVVSNEGDITGSPSLAPSLSIFELQAPFVLTASATNGSITGVSNPYIPGSNAQITAVPDAGYVFTGWTGGASGTQNPLTVLMDGNKTIGATFTPIYNVTLDTLAGGAVTGVTNPYLSGTNATLTAVPATGFVFSGWTGAASGTDNPLTVLMDGNKTVGATFTAQYTVTLDSTTNGSISGVTNPYLSGSTATLTATPADGYVFNGWTGDASGTTNPLPVTMDGNKTIGANFGLPQVTLSVSSAGTGTGSVSGAGSFTIGTNATLTASPATNSWFTGWSGAASGSQNPLTVLMNGNKAVTATFGLKAENGLSVFKAFQEAFILSLRSNWSVGDTVDGLLNLAPLYEGLPQGYSIAVTGLPPGLKFEPTFGRPGYQTITGRITGELSDAPVEIRMLDASKRLAGPAYVWDFTVSPFQLTGVYEVLLENAGLPVGKALLTVTSPTAYTASLELQGQAERRVTRGVLTALTGNAPYTVTIPFAAGRNNTPAAVSVDFIINPGSDLVTGSAGLTPVTTGIGDARGFRLARAGRSPVQRVTVALENVVPGSRTATPVPTPGGHGYATGSLAGTGLLSLRGALGDTQALTTSLRLSQTNQAVVFVQPYKGALHLPTSFIGGIITIGDLGQPGRGASTDTPLLAGLKWRKAAVPTDKSYVGGFGPLAVNGLVSKWVSVTTAEGLALSLGLDLRQVYSTYENAPVLPVLASNLAMPTVFGLRNRFTLVRLAPTNSVPSSASAVASSGTFSGRLTLGTPATGTTFNGVFLQEDKFGDSAKIGSGLIRIPTLPAGTFETAGIRLRNAVQN